MDFEFSPDVQAMQQTLRRFVEREVLPANNEWHRLADAGTYPLAVVEPLKARARAAGLWNMFLPGLKADEPGTRLSNLDYAPLAEIMGRLMWASEVFNCNAPDTGNMELLHLAATPAQYEQWLKPLLDEPSEGIAPIIVARLAEAVRAMKRQGVAVLLSEQNPRFVAAVADRALLLERGRLAGSAAIGELSPPSAAVRRVLGV